MESNGTPDRIHCSQETADRLIIAGKGNWLTKQEELITAKGKGQMQTYWVEPKPSAASSSNGWSADNITQSIITDPSRESDDADMAGANLEDLVADTKYLDDGSIAEQLPGHERLEM